jgi:hypothetical protein
VGDRAVAGGKHGGEQRGDRGLDGRRQGWVADDEPLERGVVGTGYDPNPVT